MTDKKKPPILLKIIKPSAKKPLTRRLIRLNQAAARLVRVIGEFSPKTGPETPSEEDSGRKLSVKAWGALAGLALFGLLLVIPGLGGMADPARKMAAVALLMAVWWVFEVIPIGATALIPLVALPMLGLSNPKDAAAPYGDPNVFLFVGGFMLSAAMQKWGLHKRLALNVLVRVGTTPDRVILGVMGVTAFLSMWASNTATVLMMYPIVMAMVETGKSDSEESRGRFVVALLLATAYGASIGGVATLIGTPPNIVLASMAGRLAQTEVDFAQWLPLGLSYTVICLPLAYWLLTRVLFKTGPGSFHADANALKLARMSLGPITLAERRVGLVFGATACLWVFRRDIPLGVFTLPGWESLLFVGRELHDGTVAVAMALLLFVIPSGAEPGGRLLDRNWHKAIPWDIAILFGGGFALAQGFMSSGLSFYLGDHLRILGGLPLWLLVLSICLMTTFLTELTSNTATATVLLPILAATAAGLGVHPLVLMLPATLAASAAFMLPVATPPNAIIFASRQITITQMARAGLWLNLATAPVITLLTLTLGPLLMGY
ncbi:MAG: SLC13 family permease [Deltaproteobacteria bacterium]|nr:SLC13 family permease [Deltaproteobacteria bacterium]